MPLTAFKQCILKQCRLKSVIRPGWKSLINLTLTNTLVHLLYLPHNHVHTPNPDHMYTTHDVLVCRSMVDFQFQWWELHISVRAATKTTFSASGLFVLSTTKETSTCSGSNFHPGMRILTRVHTMPFCAWKRVNIHCP